MKPEEVSKNLRAVAEEHKGDFISTFGIRVSDMATDAADAIDLLLKKMENKQNEILKLLGTKYSMTLSFKERGEEQDQEYSVRIGNNHGVHASCSFSKTDAENSEVDMLVRSIKRCINTFKEPYWLVWPGRDDGNDMECVNCGYTYYSGHDSSSKLSECPDCGSRMKVD